MTSLIPAQQLKVILQKKKVIPGIKKDQFKEKTVTEKNLEREDQGISTKGTSEIDLFQPALAYNDTNDARNSPSLTYPSEIEQTTQSEEWRKHITLTLITEDSMIAGLREAKLSINMKIKVRFYPGTKTEDLMFYSIPNLITNDERHKNKQVLYEEFKKSKI